MNALKSIIFLNRNEAKSLHHYLRPLMSSAEALTAVIGGVRLLRDMAAEILRGS